MAPLMHNAADRKAIRAKEKAARQQELADAGVIQALLATPTGRTWMWNLLSQCNIFSAIYPSHPELGAILGERNVGLRLLAQVMAHAPDQYMQMMREANERAERERASAREQQRSADAGGESDRPDDDYSDFPADDGIDREPIRVN